MTFGQMSEILFMVLMPFFFRRLGVKKMLLIGMAAWVARYAFFAEDAVWMLYAGIVLHGICYDFFFVTGQIYVDRKAGAEIRASAQGFIALITLGIGALIGAKVSGRIVEHFTLDNGHQWREIWLIPAAMAAVVFVLFALFFKEQSGADTEEDLLAQAAG
jgi:MFS family permease